VTRTVTYDGTYGTLPIATRAGYTFMGWYTDETGDTKIESGTTVAITSDQTLYAHWEPRTDIEYTVEFYKQNANNDNYTKVETETRYGTADSNVTADERVYEHFKENTSHSNRLESGVVKADGTLVLRRYYDRDTFTIEFYENDADAVVEGNTSLTLKYDQTITAPEVYCEGKTFAGWYENAEGTGERFTANAMPARSLKLYAKWTIDSLPYTVNHYVMGTDGEYTAAAKVEGLEADYGTLLTLEELMDRDLLVSNGILYDHAEVGGIRVEEIMISLNLEVNLYYKRSTYNLKWNLNGGNASNSYTQGIVYYGASITAPIVSKTGYNLKWNETPAAIMPAKDLEYSAEWTAMKVMVTFDPNGGSVSTDTKEVTYDEVYGDLPQPSKAGHDFLGWYTDKEAGGIVSSTSTVTNTANHTLYAHWQVNTHTIEFINSGTTYFKHTGNYGTTINAPGEPTRTGYTFDGWYTAPTGGTKVVIGTMVNITSDQTLYAQWKITNYTITYYDQGGTVLPGNTSANPNPTGYTIESDTINLLPPVKAGYTFEGWTWSGQSNPQLEVAITKGSTGDHSYTANWTANTYNVTFDPNGGTVSPESKNVTFGVAYGTLPEPNRTGYTFTGWYTAKSGGTKVEASTAVAIASNHTLYAGWSPIEYKITYVLNGGSLPSGYQTKYTIESSAFTLKNPARTGYTFTGWTPDGQDEQLGTVTIPKGSTGDRNYTANWAANTYTVTFNANGGEVSTASKSATYDSYYGDLPTPTRTGYEFVGWYTAQTGGDKIESDKKVTITSNQTFYARWEAIKYTVIFNSNGYGDTSGEMEAITYTYGVVNQKLPQNSFTRTGYDFTGWNTESNGSGAAYDDQAVLSAEQLENLTLYAQWEVKIFTVKFDANGGIGSMGEFEISYFDSMTLDSNQFTLEDYTFNGWNTMADGKGTYYADGAVISNVRENLTLYAQWKETEYKLTFCETAGGKVIGQLSLTAGAAITGVATPTRTGYVFNGWQPAIPSAMPKYDMTITAQWLPVISYNLDGGSAPTGTSYPTYYDPSNTAGDGVALELAPPAYAKLTFKEWAWAGTGSMPEGVTVNGATITLSQGVNVPLYFKALWEVEVTFSFNVGTLECTVDGTTVNVLSGEKVKLIAGSNLPKPVKNHWSFKGWSNGSSTKTTVPYSPTTFYDTWNYCEIYGENVGDLLLAVQKRVTVELKDDIHLEDGLGNGYGVLDGTEAYLRSNFNGNNHTIYLGTEEKHATIPLFDEIVADYTLTVKDLNVVAYITGNYATGILSRRLRKGIIQNCTVSGSITNTNPYTDSYWEYCAGGIVLMNHGTIDGCVNLADVTSKFRSGGIAAINGTALDGNVEGIITNCVNYGTITGHNSVGGIVGLNEKGEGDGEKFRKPLVEGCSNYGAVTYNSALTAGADKLGFNVGGIVGYSDQYTRIIGCYVGSTSTVTGTQNVGGIVGYIEYSVMNECDTGDTTTVSGTQNVGGIVGCSFNYNQVRYCSIDGTAAVTGTENVGGIAGYSSYVSDVTSCTTGEYTTVTGEQNVGGIAGQSQDIISCTNGSTIIRLKEDTVWGTITGYVQFKSDIENCIGGDPQYGKAMFDY